MSAETRKNLTISAGTALALVAFLFTGWTWASEAHQAAFERIAVERTRNDRQAEELNEIRADLRVVGDGLTANTVSSEVTIRLLNELKEDVGELSGKIERLRREN